MAVASKEAQNPAYRPTRHPPAFKPGFRLSRRRRARRRSISGNAPPPRCAPHGRRLTTRPARPTDPSPTACRFLLVWTPAESDAWLQPGCRERTAGRCDSGELPQAADRARSVASPSASQDWSYLLERADPRRPHCARNPTDHRSSVARRMWRGLQLLSGHPRLTAVRLLARHHNGTTHALGKTRGPRAKACPSTPHHAQTA